MSDERRVVDGPHLDSAGVPAGVRLFCNAHVDERLTTDRAGQVHFTRWRFRSGMGWQMEASFSLSAAASNELMRVMLLAGASAVEDKKGG